MKKKMLAAVLAGTMVMSLGTNLCWADGEKTKVTMTVWNGEWGDQLDRTMESFNSKHDDIELDITMQSGDYSDFLGTAAATNDWPDIFILTPWTQVQNFAEVGRVRRNTNRFHIQRFLDSETHVQCNDVKRSTG